MQKTWPAGSKTAPCFEEVSVVKPGFINLKLNKEYIADYLNKMGEDPALGLDPVENPKMILVDYGRNPNVAKPLHVGHLRSAIIGESIKRIARKMGHKVLGDIHLGDWGYQMGLIITELKKRQPQLPYFQEDFRENIRKKRHLPSENWKRSTPLPARRPKKTRRTGRRPCMPPIFCRTGTGDTGQSGTISWRFLSQI